MLALLVRSRIAPAADPPQPLAAIPEAVSGFSVAAMLGLAFGGSAALGFAYVVARDADARGSSVPTVWGVGSVVAWPAGLFYLLVYARRRERSRPMERGERAAVTVVLAGLVAFVVAAAVGPPDPFTGFAWVGAVGPLLLVPGYVLVYRRGYRRLLAGR